LVLGVYSNSCSFFWSLQKCITYSSIHAYVIDFVGTITSIISIKGILIKTHSKLIKKATFYSWNFFLSKANPTMTKDIWIRPLSFLHPLKGQLYFLSTLLSNYFFIPRTLSTILAIACCNLLQQWPLHLLSLVCNGEINAKFELLVVDGTTLEDIQIVSMYIILSSFITLYHFIFNK
jgi:hypothetical protein